MAVGPLLRLVLVCLGLHGAGWDGARAADHAPAKVANGAEPIRATALHLSGDANRTSLFFTLSQPAEARVFLMEQPDRAVVELPEVAFRLPADTGRRGQGLAGSFRQGLFAPGRSRI